MDANMKFKSKNYFSVELTQLFLLWAKSDEKFVVKNKIITIF